MTDFHLTRATEQTEGLAEWLRNAADKTFYQSDDAQLRRWAAAVSALRVPQGWQPIETAPKTGQALLLGYFNSHGKWRTLRGEWCSADAIAEMWEEEADEGWYEVSVEADDVPNCWATEPTHWMPLPPPPSSDAASPPLPVLAEIVPSEDPGSDTAALRAVVQASGFGLYANPDEDIVQYVSRLASNASAVANAIDAFDAQERGLPQAHIAEKLVREIRDSLFRLSPSPAVDEVEAEPVNLPKPQGVIAYEFLHANGHAIVDYSEHTHIGHLSAEKGYEARPLVLASERDQWAAKALDWRRKYAELRYPGMTGIVKAVASTPPKAEPAAPLASQDESHLTTLSKALQRLERAVDMHLGRSSWTQTTNLKGMGYSDAVRKELFAAHDEARAALLSHLSSRPSAARLTDEQTPTDAQLGAAMRKNYEAAKEYGVEYIRWNVTDIDAAIESEVRGIAGEATEVQS